jgi:Ferritin-like domain
MDAGEPFVAEPAQSVARPPPWSKRRALLLHIRPPPDRGDSRTEKTMEATEQSEHLSSRRSFLLKGAAVGAATMGAGRLLAEPPKALASGGLTPGDAAVLRFLAAAETLETDAWQQYNELGGIQDSEVPGGSGNPAYTEALAVQDEDMDQYIHDNTDDEFTHFSFLNAYLKAHGMAPADLEKFRTLPSSTATGAQQIGRLTNLMQLTVDTSWWTRYRSDSKNPDLGDTLPQAIPDLATGQHPGIPRSDDDLSPPDHLQAIANTAGFHFAFIEQGGTSLYPSLAQRVTSTEVLRILLSIGPTETMHFQTWQDKAGNAPPLTDPTTGLTFPDLNADGELLQTNLIMPEPTVFLDRKFPVCSIIRPTETDGAAMGALRALTANGLFLGQSAEFFTVMTNLARAADTARRGT